MTVPGAVGSSGVRVVGSSSLLGGCGGVAGGECADGGGDHGAEFGRVEDFEEWVYWPERPYTIDAGTPG